MNDHAGHVRQVCSCGSVIAQCRCPDPVKRVEVVHRGCGTCGGGGVALSPAPSPWRIERRDDRPGYQGPLLWASDDGPPVLHAFLAPGGGFGLGFRDGAYRRLFEAAGEMYELLRDADVDSGKAREDWWDKRHALLARIDGKAPP